MNNYTDFINSVSSAQCEVLTDTSMSAYSSFRVGGNADVIVFPKNEYALKNVITTAKELNLKLFILGNGSNILIKDCGIRGIVVKTTAMLPEITVKDDIISCSAGTSLAKLCMTAYENSLSGLEFAYGIPGTVGGAVYMNAGAYGGEIKDVILSASHISTDGEKNTLNAEKLLLDYRKSFYSINDGYVITSASFKLRHGSKEEIKAKMDELIAKRKDKQPLEFPSAGSTFKRPTGHFAGGLIEQCGLKGYRIGGAEVSEKHAGFIINKNNATAQDILELISFVQKTVKEKTGVILEPEVKILP